jgi:hypothetical protein
MGRRSLLAHQSSSEKSSLICISSLTQPVSRFSIHEQLTNGSSFQEVRCGGIFRLRFEDDFGKSKLSPRFYYHPLCRISENIKNLENEAFCDDCSISNCGILPSDVINSNLD